jgi:hypothetical protein
MLGGCAYGPAQLRDEPLTKPGKRRMQCWVVMAWRCSSAEGMSHCRSWAKGGCNVGGMCLWVQLDKTRLAVLAQERRGREEDGPPRGAAS